jgi:pimeloyl-ACP methyl ester carboxylesterase
MTPLLLIPGMMCDARLFAPQIAAISGTRFVACAPISEHEEVNALANDVLDNAPPKFALAGLSMGGIVAMEMLRLAPDRIDRIALIDTNPLAESETVQARRLPQIKAVLDGRLAEIMREEMKPNYLTDGPRRGEVLDLCMDMALGLGPDVFVNQSRALMGRPDQSETLRGTSVPALVMCGRDDTLCPLSRHELMADLLCNSHFEVIENAGHLPTLEQPDATNAALIRWLEA